MNRPKGKCGPQGEDDTTDYLGILAREIRRLRALTGYGIAQPAPAKDVRELAGRISAIFNDWNSDIGRLNEVATEIERTFRVRLALAREHGDVRTRQGIIELALSAERDAATAHAKLAEQARDDWKYRHDSLDAQGFELARKLEIAERKGEEIRAAATKALRKLRAYVGVCSGDKELTQSIIPSLEEALATLEPKYFGPSIIGPDGVEQIGPAIATPAEGTTGEGKV